jgi:hypothetical protein
LAVLLITFTLSRLCRELLPKLGLSKTSSKWIKGFVAPDRPEKSRHADRLGSSNSLVLDSQLARHRQLFDPIINLCQ